MKSYVFDTYLKKVIEALEKDERKGLFPREVMDQKVIASHQSPPFFRDGLSSAWEKEKTGRKEGKVKKTSFPSFSSPSLIVFGLFFNTNDTVQLLPPFVLIYPDDDERGLYDAKEWDDRKRKKGEKYDRR